MIHQSRLSGGKAPLSRESHKCYNNADNLARSPVHITENFYRLTQGDTNMTTRFKIAFLLLFLASILSWSCALPTSLREKLRDMLGDTEPIGSPEVQLPGAGTHQPVGLSTEVVQRETAVAATLGNLTGSEEITSLIEDSGTESLDNYRISLNLILNSRHLFERGIRLTFCWKTGRQNGSSI